MESDAFECDVQGCAGRARWLVWLSDEDVAKYKFFACVHCVDDLRKAVGLMNIALKMGEVKTARIDDVLVTDPRLIKGSKPQA